MGFLKDLGSLTGVVVGTVIGGPVKLVGEISGVRILEDIGDGVKRATTSAGETIGKAANGVWDVGAGFVTNDDSKIDEGFRDVGGAISNTVQGIGNTVINVAENSGKVINGALNGDNEAMKSGVRGLVTTAAIGALAIGIADMVVDFDGSDDNLIAQEVNSDIANQESLVQNHMAVSEPATNNETVILTENSNSHHVEPHWRELPNGNTIWVDGDGDSTTNNNEGWTQTNPDYRSKT